MRNGKTEQQSQMLALDAAFVASSPYDLQHRFYKYLNDEELFAKGSFIDSIEM